MRRHLASLGLLLLLPSAAWANGKAFATQVPPDIPYQRALILHRDGVQTLVLQGRIETGGEDAEDLGWVVPVPGVPEVASLDAAAAEALFHNLKRRTAQRVLRPRQRVRMAVGNVVLVAAPGLGVALLVLAGRSAYGLWPRWPGPARRSAWRICFGLGLIWIGFLVDMSSLSGRVRREVEVVFHRTFDLHEVSVLRAETVDGILGWMDEHGFAAGPEDRAAFADYVDRGWVFVATRLRGPDSARQRSPDGLAAPLVLRFPAEAPVYPLALTGTGGHDSEVVVFLMSGTVFDAPGQIRLRFLDGVESGLLDPLRRAEPEGFFGEADLEFRYLHRFWDRFTAAQMADDIRFVPEPRLRPFKVGDDL